METFYVKNKKGEFVPVKIDSVLGEELKDKLVIVRVGTDQHPASVSDLDTTCDSFGQADALKNLGNASIIVSPYQIEIGVVDDSGDNKQLYVQIVDGDDISVLEKGIREQYKKFKSMGKKVVVLPTPLKVKSYKRVREILKKSLMRKQRRSRSREN